MDSVLLVDFVLKHNALTLEEYTNTFALGCVQKLPTPGRPSQLLGKSTMSCVAVQPSHAHALPFMVITSWFYRYEPKLSKPVSNGTPNPPAESGRI